jgi:hypothetical protein
VLAGVADSHSLVARRQCSYVAERLAFEGMGLSSFNVDSRLVDLLATRSPFVWVRIVSFIHWFSHSQVWPHGD